MPRSPRRSRWWPAVLVLAGACRKEGATKTAAPDAGAAPASAAEPESLASFEADLGRLRQELDIATGHGQPVTEGAGPTTRCTRICEISTAICGLADSICGLVDDHPGESRYVTACEAARAECDQSTEVCNACSSH